MLEERSREGSGVKRVWRRGSGLPAGLPLPLVVDHRWSPPPFLFRLVHPIISGVNTVRLLSARRQTQMWRVSRQKRQTLRRSGQRGAALLGKALRAEPGEVKWLSNICQSSSNEPKPDGTSLPPLVCLPHHLQLQLLCYIPANVSTACETRLYLQSC